MEQKTSTLQAPFFSKEVISGAAKETLINLLDRQTVERSYSGKKGCMCGCKGKYSEKPSTVQTHLKNALKRIDEMWVTELQVSLSRKPDWTLTEIGGYIYLEFEDERCYCFYFPENEAEVAGK